MDVPLYSSMMFAFAYLGSFEPMTQILKQMLATGRELPAPRLGTEMEICFLTKRG